MKLVMKLLFLAFVLTVFIYVTQSDIFGPRIMLVDGVTLDFSMDQEVDNWNEYFYLYDREEGLLDDKYMTIDSQDINLSVPGVQYIYVKASDKAGNTSARSFEVRVSSGYQHLNFENFVNKDVVTDEMMQLENFDFASLDGIETGSSNATISKINGSQALKVNIAEGSETNGINAAINVPAYRRYYLKYDINVTSDSLEQDVYLPTLASKDGEQPVSLVVTRNYQLKVVDNTNGVEYIIDNTDLQSGHNTIQLELSVGDKLGEPDYVSVILNDEIVCTIENIDFGFDQIGQVVLAAYTKTTPTVNYDVYIDNVKFSMLKDDLVG